jgi:hypothetical protein
MTSLLQDPTILFKEIQANPKLYVLMRREHPEIIEKLKRWVCFLKYISFVDNFDRDQLM